jgi:2,5-diketo-D-gluconate reductase A
MIELLEQGVVRAIGVSNFKAAHLQRLVEETGFTPMSTRYS